MRSVTFEERVLIELGHAPDQVPPVERVRGTLLASSVQGVRERGLLEAYFEALAPEHHETIQGLVPATWLPVAVAVAHYRALDQLELSAETQWAMGRRVAERVQHSWVGTVIRGLKASGAVNPLQAFGRFEAAWNRLLEGGASAVVQTGPKDVRIEAHGVPMADGSYFRQAWGGMIESTLELVTRKAFVRELPRFHGPTTCAFQTSWA